MSDVASRVKAIIVDKLSVEESEVTGAPHVGAHAAAQVRDALGAGARPGPVLQGDGESGPARQGAAHARAQFACEIAESKNPVE